MLLTETITTATIFCFGFRLTRNNQPQK